MNCITKYFYLFLTPKDHHFRRGNLVVKGELPTEIEQILHQAFRLYAEKITPTNSSQPSQN